MATTTIGDNQGYSAGSFEAYVAPWGKGSLVSGKDFTESATLTPGSFPNQSVLTASWPNTPANGVYDFDAIDFGDYDGTTVPVPVPSTQINNLTALTETHNLSFSGNLQGYDTIDDTFLTTQAGNSNTNAFEVEVFLHTPSGSASFVHSSKQIGSFSSGGINWTVAEAGMGSATPDILIMPTNTADVASGTVDLKAMFQYLVAQGVVPGTDYFNGFGLGTETQSGSGSMTVNSLSVDYHGTTYGAPGGSSGTATGSGSASSTGTSTGAGSSTGASAGTGTPVPVTGTDTGSTPSTGGITMSEGGQTYTSTGSDPGGMLTPVVPPTIPTLGGTVTGATTGTGGISSPTPTATGNVTLQSLEAEVHSLETMIESLIQGLVQAISGMASGSSSASTTATGTSIQTGGLFSGGGHHHAHH